MLQVRLFELVTRAQACVAANPRQMPRQLFVGEFGFRQGDAVTLRFVRDVLALAKGAAANASAVALPAASPLSLASLGEEGGLAAADHDHFGPQPPPPPLLTLWVWEFAPQSATLSLEAGRDDWLVKELADANRAVQG